MLAMFILMRKCPCLRFLSGWSVLGPTRVHTVIVYRPPYSEDHLITAGIFFHEFAEYL